MLFHSFFHFLCINDGKKAQKMIVKTENSLKKKNCERLKVDTYLTFTFN